MSNFKQPVDRIPVMLYAAMSLDGFIAETDGGIQWLDEFNSDEFEFESFAQRVDTCIMGRTTFDHIRPYGFDSLASMTNIVLSSRPLGAHPEYIQHFHGSAADLVTDLQSQATKGIWLMGGGKTVRSFIDAGLVDELIVFTLPILLGSGIPLFPDGQGAIRVHLIENRQYQNGTVKSVYGLNNQ